MTGTYLKLGEWNAICDICKFKYKSSELKLNWRNEMVCESDWEMRNMQDFIRVRTERGSAPWVRPEGEDVFLPVVYMCTQDGTTAIANLAVAGCSIAGSVQGAFGLQRSAVAGIALTGQALAGHP